MAIEAHEVIIAGYHITTPYKETPATQEALSELMQYGMSSITEGETKHDAEGKPLDIYGSIERVHKGVGAVDTARSIAHQAGVELDKALVSRAKEMMDRHPITRDFLQMKNPTTPMLAYFPNP